MLNNDTHAITSRENVRELTDSECDAVNGGGTSFHYEQMPSGVWIAVGKDKNGNRLVYVMDELGN